MPDQVSASGSTSGLITDEQLKVLADEIGKLGERGQLEQVAETAPNLARNLTKIIDHSREMLLRSLDEPNSRLFFEGNIETFKNFPAMFELIAREIHYEIEKMAEEKEI